MRTLFEGGYYYWDTYVRAFASIINKGRPHDDCTWINGGREYSTHAAPQQFLPPHSATAVPFSSLLACHHMSITHVGMVQILFKGKILFHSAQAITQTLFDVRILLEKIWYIIAVIFTNLWYVV